MNARSKFAPLITITGTPIGIQLSDSRGAMRTVKSYYGTNKGRKYPYASKRQTLRQQAPGQRVRDIAELLGYLNDTRRAK